MGQEGCEHGRIQRVRGRNERKWREAGVVSNPLEDYKHEQHTQRLACLSGRANEEDESELLTCSCFQQTLRDDGQLGGIYSYLLTVSIVTRWLLFIVPVLGLLWIPGILSLTTLPKANVNLFIYIFCSLNAIFFFLTDMECQVALVEYLANRRMGR